MSGGLKKRTRDVHESNCQEIGGDVAFDLFRNVLSHYQMMAAVHTLLVSHRGHFGLARRTSGPESFLVSGCNDLVENLNGSLREGRLMGTEESGQGIIVFAASREC